MAKYYLLVLGETMDAAMHPMEAKKQLAAKCVAVYHGESAAKECRDDWDLRFSKRDLAQRRTPRGHPPRAQRRPRCRAPCLRHARISHQRWRRAPPHPTRLHPAQRRETHRSQSRTCLECRRRAEAGQEADCAVAVGRDRRARHERPSPCLLPTNRTPSSPPSVGRDHRARRDHPRAYLPLQTNYNASNSRTTFRSGSTKPLRPISSPFVATNEIRTLFATTRSPALCSIPYPFVMNAEIGTVTCSF